MIRNYLITSLRNLKRNWSFAMINVTGLTLGLACCLLIFFTVRYELSFDKQYKEMDRAYRLMRYNPKNADKGGYPGALLPSFAALKNDFPEIRDQVTCTYAMREMLVSVEGKTGVRKFQDPAYSVTFVDPAYFKLLDYTWLQGNPKTALANPGAVVVTESQAKRYFGTTQAVGKTLKVDNRMLFSVTGVVADPGPNTNFPFTTMLSFASLKAFGAFTDWEDWGSSYGGAQIYLKLPEDESQASFEKKLVAFKTKYIKKKEGDLEQFVLQPVHEIHFDTKAQNYSGRSISKGMIWAMVIVGAFILITACVNFVNLATAQALRRAREVGVRKALGSTRAQLLRQYFSETGLITVLSVLLALITAQIALPYVAGILNVTAEGVWFVADPVVLLFLLGLAVITTLLAGFYPAMVVSGYQPVLALKGKMRVAGSGQNNMRRSLIVLQFTISQIVLIGTIVAYSQMKYFRTKDLGFKRDEILNVRIPEEKPGQVAGLKAQLGEIPGVKSMSFSMVTPMSRSNWQTQFRLENQEEPLDFEVVMRPADTAYVNTYGLEMVAGRMYMASDTMREFVINQAFAEKLGYKNYDEVLGKRISIGGGGVLLPIVGVVKNFNTYSLHREIIPCVLASDGNNVNSLIGLKLAENTDPSQVISRIEKAWTSTFPDHLFKYTFLNETLNAFYEKEAKLFELFKILTFIAIFIGCLGLYGVVAFMAESRIKEMGIRKAIGASAANIFALFSTDFIKLVVVALVIASPLAWYVMNQWLEDFTYRISIDWWVYVLAGAAAIVIALFTISFQSLKAAFVNPVKALRSE